MYTDDELINACDVLKQIQAEKAVLEAQEEAIIQGIKEALLERDLSDTYFGVHHVKWTKYTSHRLNTKAFRAEHEDLYQQYQMTVEASRFSVN